MAEFKLSRIRYTWKGTWSSSTDYIPDDIVFYGGKAYVCLVQHTSSFQIYADIEFLNNDVPPVNIPRWELMLDGNVWKGIWSPNVLYDTNDIVKKGGVTYKCIQTHTSSDSDSSSQQEFENDKIFWTKHVDGADWKSIWEPTTYYQLNDVVKHGGNIYKCNQEHVSSENTNIGIEPDLSKWDVISLSDRWRGDWAFDVKYIENDIVRYGSIVYRCTVPHVSSSNILDEFSNDVFDSEFESNLDKWEIVHSGIKYQGVWNTDTVVYTVNDLVKFGGSVWISNETHAPATSFDVNKWILYSPGFQYEDIWNSATNYQPGDIVRYGGYLYKSLTKNVGVIPTQGVTDWVLAQVGINLRGEWKLLNIYKVGDVVRRNGQFYTAVEDNFGEDPNDNATVWQLTIPGDAWSNFWQYPIVYLIGDVVTYLGSAYRCFQKHTSSLLNRPDNDSLNEFWALFIQGTDGNVLEQPGDLKTFEIDTRVRIPVGEVGKVARVVDSSVQWEYFNEIDNVFFVGVDGVDDDLHGNTLQNPWKTVRYACEHITGPATVYVKHGVYEEILPIRVPAFVAIVGDELRGTVIKPALNVVPQEDVAVVSSMFNRIKANVQSILLGQRVESNLEFAQTYPAAAVTSVEVLIVQLLIDGHVTTLQGLDEPVITGTNTITENAGRLVAAEILNDNRRFIIEDALLFVDAISSNANYIYNRSVYVRDLNVIIDALIYDLTYPGNYKTIEAGRYYANSVNGEKNASSNMFLLRDATGLRNMTFKGLKGALTPPTDSLEVTRRPTAGAFASFDPGWGPADTTAWVGNRSPYVQNVTTFGDACVGLRVDGKLHNGGNRTIVANDFTQILSDGIGAWVSNLGASELVSVFTYYNQIGYLAEEGGKIRATNGNNSYGRFGVVSDGVDLVEVPITAQVFNRFSEASIDQIFVIGGRVSRLLYGNAGQNYSQGNITIAGSGVGAQAVVDEFRDNAVFEVRITAATGEVNAGGSGYFFTTNSAQGGSSTTVILAGADENLAQNYVGMRVFLTGGTGAGQYGYISEYDSTSKVATIAKESNNTPGWNHIVPGTLIAPTLDTTTVYTVEPRITFTGPGFSFVDIEGSTLININKWTSLTFDQENKIFVAIAEDGTVAFLNSTETNWTSGNDVPGTYTAWASIVYGNQRFVAVSADGGVAYATANSNMELSWTVIDFSGSWKKVIFVDNKFVALSQDNTQAAYSTNGISWIYINLGDFADWKSIAYGKGIYVAIAPSDSTVTGIARSEDDIESWSSTDQPVGVWRAIAYGNDRFVVLETDNAYWSVDGIAWSLPITLPADRLWSDLIYAQGLFVAVAENDTTILISTDGVEWQTQSLGESENWSSIAYGDNKFVVISGAGSDSAGGDEFRIFKTGAHAQARARVVSGRISNFFIWETGSGYETPPSIIIGDPNVGTEVGIEIRVASGVLSSPSFKNKGNFYLGNNVNATVIGNGFADKFQIGKELVVTSISRIPSPGDNLTVPTINDYVFKVVGAEILEGTGATAIVRLTIIRGIERSESLQHLTQISIRQNYSQVRITGHDFLDIGLGNFAQTNYPDTLTPTGTVLSPENEFTESNGGRVFYTSTDQDGNFRVGELFRVDQATGSVTLNAEFFELQGLEELRLGGVSVGGTGVVIREFSTDSTFTADSNNIISTQKAIKRYLTQRVSGGGSDAITGGVVSGTIRIGPDLIETTTGFKINIPQKVNFTKGIDGSMLALNYFLRDPE